MIDDVTKLIMAEHCLMGKHDLKATADDKLVSPREFELVFSADDVGWL